MPETQDTILLLPINHMTVSNVSIDSRKWSMK